MEESLLRELIGRVPQWSGAQGGAVSFLAGGITNRNYRVEVNGEAFVLRVGGANTELLGINRRHEYEAHRAAAGLGIAPEVIHFLEPEGYLVTRFIAGRPIPPAEMGQPENIERVAEALRRIHHLPAVAATFSPFRTVEEYTQTARRYGVAFPADFGWYLERMKEIEQAFLRDPFTPCLCHNDLLNENFLDDGRLRILDWEYAGMGDPFFDLANFAAHHQLSDDQQHHLLSCYFTPPNSKPSTFNLQSSIFARLKLMEIMSDFREAMWGLVQCGISDLDFDFRSYADRYFQRMAANLIASDYTK
ncbi:MAG: phosphotransferase [Chloroflexota bacterium]